MRSFLGFAAFVVLLVGVLALVVLPIVARPLIVSLVRDASPFAGPPLEVEVDVGPSLLGGTVDRLTVRGSALVQGDASIGSLALVVTGFSIVDRSFAAIDGTLHDVRLARDDGADIELRTVQLDGPSNAVTAIALLDAAATEALVRSTLAGSGIVPDAVVLEAGTIGVQVSGIRVDARLEIRDGAITLVTDQLVPAIRIVGPEPDDTWRLDHATVATDGVTIEGTIDVEAVLAD
jgi:hypothetical protein